MEHTYTSTNIELCYQQLLIDMQHGYIIVTISNYDIPIHHAAQCNKRPYTSHNNIMIYEPRRRLIASWAQLAFQILVKGFHRPFQVVQQLENEADDRGPRTTSVRNVIPLQTKNFVTLPNEGRWKPFGLWCFE
jgi:hypothetical protein